MPRRLLTIHGQVQGVGFRPHVYALAHQLRLTGSVRNHGGAVQIEIEGHDDALDAFLSWIRERSPPQTRIDSISSQPVEPRSTVDFTIEPSSAGVGEPPFIPSDTAVCADCV